MRPAMQNIIETRRLVVKYGQRKVVNRLDLAVDAGCVYALLGGNGAGKTTTLNALLGFVAADAGEVMIEGVTLAQNPKSPRKLAYLPENVALYPYMSGVENLRYFCALADIKLTAAAARALLNDAGLPAQAQDARVATYSKGMRQKVGLSIAYARQTRGMLLDEPTSGLDPSAANDFAQRIRAAGNAGMAVLMATHDLFNAKQVADRIGIMKEGRIVAEIDAHRVGHQELEDLYLAHARGLA
jgi:ABC-2 type transport system ATP-binding protein